MSRRALALLVAAALAAAAAVVGVARGADEGPAAPAADGPAAPAADAAGPSTLRGVDDDEDVGAASGSSLTTAGGEPLYDRVLKCDLLEALPRPPQLVVLGGSRAMRFEPSFIRRLTGLRAFNFAVRASRPEDAFAILSYMLARAPKVKLRVVYPLQTTAFADGPLHPVLLDDPRFSRWFPVELLRRERARAGPTEPRGIPAVNRYDRRGGLLYNGYDEKLARGVTRRWILRTYIERVLPGMARPGPPQERSRRYFEKTLALCNEHGIVPAVILMPYHPQALAAFRSVGWGDKHQEVLRYLHGLEGRYDLAVLDYTEIASFGGDERFFYDGSHIMKQNARRLLRQAVRDAPQCF